MSIIIIIFVFFICVGFVFGTGMLIGYVLSRLLEDEDEDMNLKN